MNKRYIYLLLSFLLLIGTALPARAWEPEADELSGKYILLMEAESGAVLFEKNADEKAYPASTTKIMTAIVALEKGSLDEEVTVGKEVNRFGSGSSLMHIKEGEKLKLRDLLYGIMLVSGNDAAASIAVHLGGSISGFADMMNEKATALGMTGTHFVNPHGVQDEEHYSTARDMAKLAAYALKNTTFREIIKTRVHTVEPTNKAKDGHTLENTNMLVNTTQKNKEKNLNYEYRYAIGIKTGDTPVAKRCLVAAAEKDGVTLICVQLFDEDNYKRFENARDLFEWGFSNFTTNDVAELGLPETVEVRVANSSFEEDDTLVLDVDLSGKQVACLMSDWESIKNNASAISASVIPIGEISAPVKKGDLLASVAYKLEGNTLFKADAYASRDVQEMGAATGDTPSLPTIAPLNNGNGGAGPWLFIILVVAALLLALGVIAMLHNRKRGVRRRRRRGVYAYRRQ